jgi:hypothetical protein
LGTSFVFTLIGVFLGMAGAVTSTVALYRAVLGKQQAKARGAPPTDGGDNP